MVCPVCRQYGSHNQRICVQRKVAQAAFVGNQAGKNISTEHVEEMTDAVMAFYDNEDALRRGIENRTYCYKDGLSIKLDYYTWEYL
jgi:hypothetical protein